jgi:hypothetical protein
MSNKYTTESKTVDNMIQHAETLRERDHNMYVQLVHSLRVMHHGGHGGQPEPWSLYTVRSEYYPGWTNEDFGQVLDRIDEARLRDPDPDFD